MFSLRRKKPPLLGIDISTAAVKLLELSKSGNNYRVESFGVAPLPPDSMAEKTITLPEAVGSTIKTLLTQSGCKLKHVAVAVAASSVISKVISMPSNLSEDEMEAQIEMEADQYIPYALDEVSLDFEVIGPSAQNRDMLDVLLVASRRENVEDRVAVIELAGLKAVIVDIESYALENAFTLIAHQLHDVGPDATVAIVDIGATMTTLNVLHNNRVIYTREQGFGGKQLTEEIQRRYGLSYEEAGLAKKHGGLPDNYLTEVLEPFKQALSQQVGRSLQFFHSSSSQKGVDHLVLAGGCASIAGIDRYIEQSLAIPTIIANPFLNMSYSNRVKPQNLGNDASAMMTACGLAMRSFD
jgi:type IV pilus assembly protein PilM